MAPFVLKFKGNRSFVAFQSMADADALTKTWKVCTKVAQHLEQGARLENLSWRLWHLHNLIVEADNAKSKRDFKKLSKNMGDKLDREKGRSIEELPAPGFKPTPAQEKLRQRAEEKERAREAVSNGTVPPKAHYNYTFSVEPAAALHTERRPSFGTSGTKSHKKSGGALRMTSADKAATTVRFPAVFGDSSFEPHALLYSSTAHSTATARTYGEGAPTNADERAAEFGVVRPTFELALDDLLSDGQSPEAGGHNAMLDSQATLVDAHAMSYADSASQASGSGSGGTPPTASTETHFDYAPFAFYSALHQHVVSTSQASAFSPPNAGATFSPSATAHTGFSFGSPHASGLGLQMNDVDWASPLNLNVSFMDPQSLEPAAQPDTAMELFHDEPQHELNNTSNNNDDAAERSPSPLVAPMPSPEIPLAQVKAESLKDGSTSPYAYNGSGNEYNASAEPSPPPPPPPPPMPAARPIAGRSTNNSASTSMPPPAAPTGARRQRSEDDSGYEDNVGGMRTPSATATPRNPDGKTECSNCGATHTPLWRRGLNDELNCNACGLYCKLHKRPRPKNFRNGQDGARAGARAGAGFVDGGDGGPAEPVSCYNCHTTTTPLWRKDEEGRTVCNACGLYSKLHGSSRPMSMKSESIRKRARHEGGAAATRRSSVSSRHHATNPARRRRSPTPPAQLPAPQQQVQPMSPPVMQVQAHDVAETYNGVLDANGRINLGDLDPLEDGLASLGMSFGPVTYEQHVTSSGSSQRYDVPNYNAVENPQAAVSHQQQQQISDEQYAQMLSQEVAQSAWAQPQAGPSQQQQPEEAPTFVTTVNSPQSNKRRRLSMDTASQLSFAAWAGAGVPLPDGYLYGHGYHPPLNSAGGAVPESPVMHPPLNLPGGALQQQHEQHDQMDGLDGQMDQIVDMNAFWSDEGNSLWCSRA